MICTLCPRQCRADRAISPGFCGLGEEMHIARIAPHLWEEPPISGTRGTGAVFFSGCTLRCIYCQNSEISHTGAGRAFTPRELSDALKRLTDLGVQSLSLITGTPFVPRILDALELWRPPLPIIWNTSGYETVETLHMLEGAVDVFLPDLKHYSSRAAQLCAKAPDYFEAASAAIREMCRITGPNRFSEDGILLRGVLIRHLILPGLTGESMKLLTWVKDNLPFGTPVSLMRQYIPAAGVSGNGKGIPPGPGSHAGPGSPRFLPGKGFRRRRIYSCLQSTGKFYLKSPNPESEILKPKKPELASSISPPPKT